jgi:hypothetical protein
LKNGGLYIAEDLHTNFGSLATQYQGTSSISFVDYAKKLIDLRVADDQVVISNEEDPFLRTYGRNIQFLIFYRRACVLKKHYRMNPQRILGETAATESNDVSDDLLSEFEGADVLKQLSIMCHIGEIGNRKSLSGALTVLRDNLNIQGFTIFADDSISRDLQYRVRLADGKWTEWIDCDSFAGTTGRSLNLTGFSARLVNVSKDNYTLELAGQFRGSAAVVKVSDGQDCVPPTGLSQLYGMQITIRSKPQGPSRSKPRN